MKIKRIETSPYSDQMAGTSGLRKKTRVFLDNPYYLENYLQSCLQVLIEGGVDLKQPILIGGDGRFFNAEAIQIAIRLALANGFKSVLTFQDGLLSTPAASLLIRQWNASFAIVFSASHNPGGEAGDVGIKLNIAGGAPAPQALSQSIYQASQSITHFFSIEMDDIDLTTLAQHSIAPNTSSAATVEVRSSVQAYADIMQSLFDFPQLRAYLQSHQVIFDAMHAVTGPYALEIFHERLGLAKNCVLNSTPLADFGGGLPDPSPATNPTLYKLAKSSDCEYSLLIASDGDGDRNMILGKDIYVSPGDSLALIAQHSDCIPHLRGRLRGVARSMPTSRAVDRVCQAHDWQCYETPTGWKYFFDLLEGGDIQLCGEESFGTSSDHCREKDGIWAGLCWLSILASHEQSLKKIVAQHWQQLGRHYYQRHDFSGLSAEVAEQILNGLQTRSTAALQLDGQVVTSSGEFFYTSPNGLTEGKGQGYQVVFAERARFIMRLSGTDTGASTLRLYLEYYDAQDVFADSDDKLAPLLELAMEFIDLTALSGKLCADQVV